jgi:hypothetical protein
MQDMIQMALDCERTSEATENWSDKPGLLPVQHRAADARFTVIVVGEEFIRTESYLMQMDVANRIEAAVANAIGLDASST